MSHTGEVKSWSDQKGYGFITPNDGSGDVFVHRRAIGMQSILIPKKPVTYDFQMEKGKPKATAVSGEGVVRNSGFQGGRGYNPQHNVQQMGVIKTWLPEKGYGFISQGPNGQGDDLFVMTSNTVPTQATPAPGDKVMYTIGVNPKNGKFWAENVAVLGGFDAMYGGGYNPQAALAAAQYWQQQPHAYGFPFSGYYPTA